jgi:hypothetical protein
MAPPEVVPTFPDSGTGAAFRRVAQLRCVPRSSILAIGMACRSIFLLLMSEGLTR